MKTAGQVETVGRISAFDSKPSPANRNASPPKLGVGFLLVDRSLSYVSCNGEAIQILGYPDNIERLTRSQLLLTKEIRSRLKTERSSDNSLFVTQFQSGRRRYFCRAFQIDTHTGGSDRPGIAVLFERGPSALVPLSQVGKQFNLTQREREALEYVLQGLSSKAIANRMRISPNTVKAYMRLIMIKTGVSSRSAMISKIILTQPQ